MKFEHKGSRAVSYFVMQSMNGDKIPGARPGLLKGGL